VAGRVLAVAGRRWVEAVEVEDQRRQRRIRCDLLAVSFPGQGAFELPHQAGFSYRLGPGRIPEERTLLPAKASLEKEGVHFFVVGEAAGKRSLEEKCASALATTRANRRAESTGQEIR